ncbi:VOC family protein [Shimia sp.]|uniref:VOC family protein n=1 Tax=Shimia sp. TaxID=1954381 RepID=UPI003B8CCA0B
MSTQPDPSQGLHTVTPYFTVPDADLFIEFAQNVFGAQVIKENRYENGVVQHARLRIGTSVVMINQATDGYLANRSQMHLQVSDATNTYRTALQHGAQSIMEPNLRPHGEWMAGVIDTSNNTWWIASPKG